MSLELAVFKNLSASAGGLNLPELKQEARKLGLDTTGSRAEIVARLARAMTGSGGRPQPRAQPKARARPKARAQPKAQSKLVKHVKAGARLSARQYYNKYGSEAVGDRCDIRNDGKIGCLIMRRNGSPYWAYPSKTGAGQERCGPTPWRRSCRVDQAQQL